MTAETLFYWLNDIFEGLKEIKMTETGSLEVTSFHQDRYLHHYLSGHRPIEWPDSNKTYPQIDPFDFERVVFQGDVKEAHLRIVTKLKNGTPIEKLKFHVRLLTDILVVLNYFLDNKGICKDDSVALYAHRLVIETPHVFHDLYRLIKEAKNTY